MLRRPASLVAVALALAGPAAGQTVPAPAGAGTGTWAIRTGPDAAAPAFGAAVRLPAGAAAGTAMPGGVTAPGTAAVGTGRTRDPSRTRPPIPWLGPPLDPPDPLAEDAVPGPPAPDRPAGTAAPAGVAPTAGRTDRRDGRPRAGWSAAPETTGAVRRAESRRAPGAAEAAAPVPPGLRTTVEDPYREDDEPFAPQGLRAGGFVLLPAVEAAAGASSNVAGGAGGKAGSVLSVAPELKVRSDWTRHAFDLDLRGSYTSYPGQRDYDKPAATVTATGRVDLADGMRLDLRGGYSLQREQAGSAENPSGTVVPSNVETWTGSAGFTRDVGLVWATLRGDLETTRYSGGTGAGGAALTGTEARDNTRMVGALRTGYHLSPAIGPYIEVQATRRGYTDPAAAAQRDADGWGLRGGVLLDFGPILKGDLGAGWSQERPRGAGLGTLSGYAFDGSLVWLPTRLSRITLTAKTAFEPTTLAGSSGSVARSLGVTVAQSLTRRLSAEATATVLDRRYEGLDRRERDYAATAALYYALGPTLQVFVRGGFERFEPSAPDPAYDVETVMVGVRLQR